MQRRPKRAPGPAGGLSFDALPDELLQAVLHLVPEFTSQLLGPAVELQSRGSVERVCRRWRRFALQLPASVCISFCQAHDLIFSDREVAAVLESLLPHLACRRITALSISGCTSVLSPHVPALLACALYPELRSLRLSGASLLHFTSFLPLCARLEQLSIDTDFDDYDECTMDPQLLCSHLCGLRCSLRLLDLTTDLHSEPLATTVSRHVQPAAVRLHTHSLASVLWIPQLQECSVAVLNSHQLARLNVRLQESLLPQLRSLVLRDLRPAMERRMTQPTLLALPLLPALCKLDCINSMPQSTWRCPHLTSLLVTDAKRISAPEAGAAQCTSLRQLQFDHCSFVGGTFPGTVCSALCQLSSLALCNSVPPDTSALRDPLPPDLTALPPELSLLSSLRQLVISGATIKPPSLGGLRQLPGLTALRLRECKLEHLPAGPYLSRLRSLDVSHNSDQLAFTIPFAATAARGLQALCIDFNPCNLIAELDADELRQWWADMQWRLHCFRGLKVLCMEVEPAVAAEPEVQAVLADIRTAIPSSCCLDLEGDLGDYSNYNGLAKFR